jgi:hypothetical protein
MGSRRIGLRVETPAISLIYQGDVDDKKEGNHENSDLAYLASAAQAQTMPLGG